ncbi:septal ring lytic transglycosylase RlpA family protein [Kamptonema cortianum]|nr:septal ring lytic transglycosylase RlpA family protein [Oscillatoria laete-virens]MDK3156471.1 septal ring lytic transglycosylase RlpA family protein [Kamptonema cortianum]MDL5053846.1 septal ring lytic transglycosylase RlpA family protein [Oscillatoria laete-virens NRMC-F 0139]
MMSRRSIFLSFSLVILFVSLPMGCSSTRSTPAWSGEGIQKGQASWYGGKFHGRKTASGEMYDMNRMTAAHRTLPFGTVVRVTNLKNGKTTTVRINDRGPFVKGRIIDLSRAAAVEIDMTQDGVVPVEVVVVR